MYLLGEDVRGRLVLHLRVILTSRGISRIPETLSPVFGRRLTANPHAFAHAQLGRALDDRPADPIS